MTTAALINKLKKKLDKETDKGILKSIDILLRDNTKEAHETAHDGSCIALRGRRPKGQGHERR